MTVQSFENELTELFQEAPDLHSAPLSYQEARGRIIERKRNRGFWPLRSSSSSSGGRKGFGPRSKGHQKGQSKGEDELLNRIARTHCKRCGELGHWKAECPQRAKESQANVTSAMPVSYEPDTNDQVLFEEIESDYEVRGVGKESNCSLKVFQTEPKEDCRSPLVRCIEKPETYRAFCRSTFFRRNNNQSQRVFS